MPFPVWTLIISGALWLCFFLLFQAENSRGRRFFLVRSRSALDLKLVYWQTILGRKISRFKHWDLRVTLHFILHLLIGAVLYVTRKVESQLDRLRMHNHRVATVGRSTGKGSHLDHIVAHKETTALTTRQKEALKKRSLNN